MKKLMVVTGVFALVALMVACSDSSAEDACKKVESLCNSSTSGGDGGVSSSVTVTCKADQVEEASNASEVTDCVESAKDCSAATACLLKAKK
jgi:hypothetical protein